MATFAAHSIAAGAGWWMAYREGDSLRFYPVLCFALIDDPDDPDERMIIGQSPEIALEGVEYHLANNFCGYFHETEFVVVGERLKKAAEDRAFAGR